MGAVDSVGTVGTVSAVDSVGTVDSVDSVDSVSAVDSVDSVRAVSALSAGDAVSAVVAGTAPAVGWSAGRGAPLEAAGVFRRSSRWVDKMACKPGSLRFAAGAGDGLIFIFLFGRAPQHHGGLPPLNLLFINPCISLFL